MTRFSFKTAQQETTWSNLETFWREADQIEVFDAGWAFDHFYPLWTDSDLACFEGWTVLSALAGVAKRVRLGLMVSSNTYRHPAVHANIVATLDHISGGRLEFGFGAGWFEDEHEAYGIDLPPLKERFDRFDEAVEIIHSLLTFDRTTFEGQYYQLEDAACEPKGIQSPHPPFVIGGKGERRTLRTAARWADHWNYPIFDPQDFTRKVEVLARWCEEEERDMREIEKSIQIQLQDPGALRRQAEEAIEAGADHVIVYFPPPHDVSLLEPVAEALEGLR